MTENEGKPYKTRGAKVHIELVKAGKEILLKANREGLQYLSEICEGLLDEEYDPRRPPHFHVEPAMNTAEPDSLPLEILLRPDPWIHT